MLAGKKDALVSYATDGVPILDKVANSQLVSIGSGSHSGFSGITAPLRWLDNPDVIACWVIHRSLDNADEEPWLHLIGSLELGVDQQASNSSCTLAPQAGAMNVLRQHMITLVVVSSFFDSHFAASEKKCDAAGLYLSKTLEQELPGVNFRQAR